VIMAGLDNFEKSIKSLIDEIKFALNLFNGMTEEEQIEAKKIFKKMLQETKGNFTKMLGEGSEILITIGGKKMAQNEELDIDGKPIEDVELDKKVKKIMLEKNKGKEKSDQITYAEAYEILKEREAKLEEGEEDAELSEKVQKIMDEEEVDQDEAYSRLKERGQV